MGSLLIRNLPDRLKQRLRSRAAENGHSMEEEARTILRDGLTRRPKPTNLAELAQELFGPKGVELEIPARGQVADPPDFGDDRS